MSDKSEKKIQAKPLKQLVSENDIAWMHSSQEADINKFTGDEQFASKAAHSARRFKQNMIYNARKTNVNTHKKHFSEELDFHASRMGWWDIDYDGPHIKNIDKKWHYTR